MDERLIDALGLRDLLAPATRAAARGAEVRVQVERGLDSMAEEIDRATREWLESSSGEGGEPESA